jgi:hypothetical protein
MIKPAGADLKIKRAKEHICDLDTRLTTFKNGNPYKVVPELDSNMGKRVFRFREKQSIPAEISLRTGEVIQNLRSALDYVVWALVESNGSTPTRDNCFPISENAKKYKTGSPGKVKGMCQRAVDCINLTKPDKGGTEALWQLHELNNSDKHRLLLTAGIGFRVTVQQRFGSSVVIGRAGGHGGSVLTQNPIVNVDFTPSNAAFPIIYGTEILALPAELNMNPQFTFDVAFNEPSIIEREPILPFLHQLTHLVEEIVGLLGSFL